MICTIKFLVGYLRIIVLNCLELFELSSFWKFTIRYFIIDFEQILYLCEYPRLMEISKTIIKHSLHKGEE